MKQDIIDIERENLREELLDIVDLVKKGELGQQEGVCLEDLAFIDHYVNLSQMSGNDEKLVGECYEDCRIFYSSLSDTVSQFPQFGKYLDIANEKLMQNFEVYDFIEYRRKVA